MLKPVRWEGPARELVKALEVEAVAAAVPRQVSDLRVAAEPQSAVAVSVAMVAVFAAAVVTAAAVIASMAASSSVLALGPVGMIRSGGPMARTATVTATATAMRRRAWWSASTRRPPLIT